MTSISSLFVLVSCGIQLHIIPISFRFKVGATLSHRSLFVICRYSKFFVVHLTPKSYLTNRNPNFYLVVHLT